MYVDLPIGSLTAQAFCGNSDACRVATMCCRVQRNGPLIDADGTAPGCSWGPFGNSNK